MQWNIRAMAALAAAALLMGPTGLPALAAEEAPASEGPITEPGSDAPPPTPSVEPEPPEIPTAGDWDTLWRWINANKGKGGAIALTADITVPANEPGQVWQLVAGSRDQGVTVQCGAHTIFIEPGAALLLDGGKAAFTGEGGDAGLIHIRPGGYFAAVAVSLLATDGNALVQEEGAWAAVDQWDFPCAVEGELLWAEAPVLRAADVGDLSGDGLPVAVIPEGRAVEGGALPARLGAHLNYLGDVIRVEGGVAWDVEAQADSLSQRQRTLLTGTFSGPLAVDPLDENRPGLAALDMAALLGESCAIYSPANCVAVFPEGGAALTQCSFQARGNILIADAGFLFSGTPAEARLLWSKDEGRTWERAAALTPQGEEGSLLAIFSESPPDGSWFLVELAYLREDGAETLVHTDTIALSGGVIAPMAWGDGHRGGGEPIGPGGDPPNIGGSTPPPPSGGEDEDDEDEEDGANVGSEPPARPDPPDGDPVPGLEPDPAVEPDGPPAADAIPAAEQEPPTVEPDSLPAGSVPPSVEQELPTASGPHAAAPPVAAAPRIPAYQAPAPQPQDSQGADEPPHAGAAAPAEPSAPSTPEAEGKPAQSEGKPPARERAGEPREPGGLSPAAQAALGLCAVLAIAAGATAALNPLMLRRLFQRRR